MWNARRKKRYAGLGLLKPMSLLMMVGLNNQPAEGNLNNEGEICEGREEEGRGASVEGLPRQFVLHIEGKEKEESCHDNNEGFVCQIDANIFICLLARTSSKSIFNRLANWCQCNSFMLQCISECNKSWSSLKLAE
jgi:hypothetical protein